MDDPKHSELTEHEQRERERKEREEAMRELERERDPVQRFLEGF